jgi:hypothetical protein
MRWEGGWCILIACLLALFSELGSHVEVVKGSSGRSCLELDFSGRDH